MQKKINIAEIISENKRRLSVLTATYDPISGIGSTIPRMAFYMDDQQGCDPIFIPETMLSEPLVHHAMRSGNLKAFARRMCKREAKPFDMSKYYQLQAEFMQIRFDHDFEYWAFTTIKITDKDSGLPVPFKLNLPQRTLLRDFERQRWAGIPIRTIICKARQWGGSTLTQVYFGWVQIRLKTGWGSVIVAHVENQARNIRSMFSRFAATYPQEVGVINLKPFEGSAKTRVLEDRNCIMDITSTESPESTRSFDYALCHLSEVGLWRGTLLKKPEDMVQNLRAGVKKTPLSMVVLESTAKGVGNFFHREWLDAKTNKSSYSAVFIPWHLFDKYMKEIKEEEYEVFINQMSDDDWGRWHQGATLEGIKWYNDYMRAENYDKWRMESEFPGDDEEAFQSTGNTVFHRKYIAMLEKGCRRPELIGRLHAEATKGKDALRNIEFESRPEGNLWIWQKPDKSVNVKNRYVVTVDIGGTTDGSDWSVIRVLDRYWLMDGGIPETVATWRGHIDQDLLAWVAVQIAKWYNNALLAVESNSLKKEELAAEGDHFLTVLDEISEVYDNLYTRTSPEKVKEGAPVLWGFHTNRQTKQLIIDNYKAMLRDQRYVETDERLIPELKSYQRMEDGTLGAVDGMHDDMVMSTAIGLYISEAQMPLPVEFVPVTKQQRRAKARAKGKGLSESLI
jgi:hypothetical protein